jgi:hypothetical protein
MSEIIFNENRGGLGGFGWNTVWIEDSTVNLWRRWRLVMAEEISEETLFVGGTVIREDCRRWSYRGLEMVSKRATQEEIKEERKKEDDGSRRQNKSPNLMK